MTDRTFFIDRPMLYRMFGDDVLAVRKFETMQEKVATTEQASTANVADTQTLREATFVTLSANAELPNERTLAVGPGLTIDTSDPNRVRVMSNVYSDDGWTVQLNAVGETMLQLPLAGILATTGGEETLRNKTLNAPKLSGLVDAADDTAAASAGVPVGGVYRNGGVVRVRLA